MSNIVVVEEWAGHLRDQQNNHDKIWAAALIQLDAGQGAYMAVWGRRDKTYSGQTKPKHGEPSMLFSQVRRLYEKKVTEQEYKDGYKKVPFNDPLHGNIPSFKQGGKAFEIAGYDGAAVGTGLATAKVNAENLVLQIDSLLRRLSEAGRRGGSITSLVMENRMLRVKLDVWCDFSGATATEQQEVLVRYEKVQGALREHVLGAGVA